ncbi:hypothetical protein B5M09_007675 [Aphanomyces astaci]|uniref:shikimate kinase n=1 Tax=Aphanomyces astaci TaxID=112090 RepID=A0A3R7Y1C4_APHAT|nr:hypothetical protein B5M09_007675 [Aphanomyces astaci]
MQEIPCKDYVVQVGHGLLASVPSQLLQLLPNITSFIVVSDSNVAPLYAQTLLQGFKRRAELYVIPAGEASKNRRMKAAIEDFMLEKRMHRDCCVVALGGGVVGDLAGFVASTYMRGVPFVQIPTSLLACVDSSIGGKTGIDVEAGKNLVGAFHQPKRVFVDLDLLSTLPKRELINGMAEIIKAGAIYSDALFSMLESNVDAILALKQDVVLSMVAASIAIKTTKNSGGIKKLILLTSIGKVHSNPFTVAVEDSRIAHVLEPQVLVVPPSEPISGTVNVPGSKSISNRVLLLAALGAGTCRISGLLHSDDTQVMMDVLQYLGAQFSWEDDGDVLVVVGTAGKFPPSVPSHWYLSNAGTAARFLTTVATLAGSKVHLTGNARMQERPISDLVDALVANGCAIEYGNRKGCPPLEISPTGLPGGVLHLAGKVSSQYVSSVLLSAPYADAPLELQLAEDNPTSFPYIQMTTQLMELFGIHVQTLGSWPPRGSLKAIEIDMETMTDAFMTLAVLAAAATGRTKITGIANQRVKECNRIAVMCSTALRVSFQVPSYPPPPLATKAASTIYLIGMRGVGKTSLGKHAASALGLHWIDMDELNSNNIEYVAVHGWAAFRAQEVACLQLWAKDPPQNTIISCGGGVVESAAAVALLTQASNVIYLQRELADVQAALAHDTSRPAYGEAIADVFHRRAPLFAASSSFVFAMLAGDVDYPRINRDFERLVTVVLGRFDSNALKSQPDSYFVSLTFPHYTSKKTLIETVTHKAHAVELRVDLLESRGSAILASFHAIHERSSAERVRELFDLCAWNGQVDIAKVVLKAYDVADALMVHRVAQECRDRWPFDMPCIALCTTEAGKLSRVLNRTLTPVTHAALPVAAAPVARRFGGTAVASLTDLDAVDVVVGTIPAAAGFVLPEHLLSKHVIVMDAAYKPAITPLLAQAHAHGAVCIQGYEMLVEQGLEQSLLWTHEAVAKEVLASQVKATLAASDVLH